MSNNEKKYVPTDAPILKQAPTLNAYDTTSYDSTTKGADALGAMNTAASNLTSYGTFDMSKFSQADWMNQVLGDIQNGKKFSYDVNGDALYQQYKDSYMRQGKIAMQDAMGQAAAMTGGYGNSYAASVGNQAYQSYLQQLNDRIPELYQLALDRYNTERQDLYNQYGLLENAYNREHDTFNEGYSRLQDAYGIASDNYYKGGDMFYTEQNNKNSVVGNQNSESLSIWDTENNNLWEAAKWTESLNQYANDEQWRQDTWNREEQWRTEDRDREEQWRREDRADAREKERLAAKAAKANALAKNNTPTLNAKEYNEVLENAGVYAEQGKSALKTYLNGLVSRGLSQDEAADIYEQYFPSLPKKTPTFQVGTQQHTLN